MLIATQASELSPSKMMDTLKLGKFVKGEVSKKGKEGVRVMTGAKAPFGIPSDTKKAGKA